MTEFEGFSSKVALVTGASGFIGSHLCRHLLDLGAEVHAVSRGHAPGMALGVRWWRHDLGDAESTASLLKDVRPDLVFHLAGLVTGKRSLDLVLPALQSNLVDTVNLLVAATDAGCERVVLAGSLEEPEPGEAAIPVSPYAAAKGASTAYAQMFHALYQTPITVARLFMVYGPAQHDLSKLVPYTTLSLLRHEAPRIGSAGRPVDWVYVDDVVRGLIACSMSDQVLGRTVDIGSGRLHTVREVVDCLVRLIDPEAVPIFDDAVARGTERIRRADVEDAKARLNWAPEVTLETGLKRTVDWYSARLRSGVSRDLSL